MIESDLSWAISLNKLDIASRVSVANSFVVTDRLPLTKSLKLVETVYLLRSPANARRLLDAIDESKTGKIRPQMIEELQEELGIEQEEKEES